MKYSRIIGTALAVFAFAAPATASPITYTEEGTGSGTLDGHPFTNDLIDITLDGDTNNIVLLNTLPPPPAPKKDYENPVGFATATVTVTGVGTDTLKTFVLENQSVSEAGFGASILLTQSPAFAPSFGPNYDLGPIGPTSGPIGFDTVLNANFPTGSGGTFKIASIGTTTFSATSATPETPLPAAFPLFATDLGALGMLGWFGKRKARVSLLGAA
jgi:hypothetical protein